MGRGASSPRRKQQGSQEAEDRSDKNALGSTFIGVSTGRAVGRVGDWLVCVIPVGFGPLRRCLWCMALA